MPSETTSRSIERMLMLAKAGDTAILGGLLNHYSNYMKVLCHARLDPRIRGRVDASDVVQESILEAYRDFTGFEGNTSAEFTGWLRKILVHNLARVIEFHLQAAKRDVRQERLIDDLTTSVNRSHGRFESMLAHTGRSPSSHADHQERLEALANAIAGLPPVYRDVIVLRHIEGLPFSEVALQMDRTPGATRMLWMRALEQLRDVLQRI